MIELIYDDHNTLSFWEKFFYSNSLSYRLNDISSFEIDLEKAPDEIIYLNCTGNLIRYAVKSLIHVKVEQYLDYLAIYNRHVINDFNTFNYIYNLIEQYRMFKRYGLSYPFIVFSSNLDELLQMCNKLSPPFQLISNIPSEYNIKNLFNNVGELKAYLDSEKYSDTSKDVLVVRQFIPPKDKKHYKVLVIDEKIIYVYCLDIITGKFELRSDIEDLEQLLKKYSNMMTQTGFKFAELEFITAKNNAIYTICFRSAPILNEEIESITYNAGSKALLNLLK